MKKIFIIFFLVGLLFANLTEAKKIKNTLKIEKESKKHINKYSDIEGWEIQVELSDVGIGSELDSIATALRKISFAGYEKEINSSQESFILINPTEETITGFEVKIEYLDMKERMLHSRTVKLPCLVPAAESRKFDIKSWDPQHTYFYYLGNEPKKVASPYKVRFTPISYCIKL